MAGLDLKARKLARSRNISLAKAKALLKDKPNTSLSRQSSISKSLAARRKKRRK